MLVCKVNLPQEQNYTDEEDNEGSNTNNNDDTGHVKDTGGTVDGGDDWIIATISMYRTVWYFLHPMWRWRGRDQQHWGWETGVITGQ